MIASDAFQKTSGYRSDIDGLRAVAILSVLLFHAEMGLHGGFVGVDVFFVISGFLITGIIKKEIQDGTFSWLNFMERRVRRIFPASAVMCIVVLCLGYWILLPRDFLKLGQSALSQQMLASNVYFWRDSGYFATGNSAKLLLHTWSLAIEEQFYLVLPIALYWTRKAKWLSWGRLLTAAIALSFVANILLVQLYPGATFFLLPTRAWELLCGSVLSLANFSWNRIWWVRESLGIVGVAVILLSILITNEQVAFPGWFAVGPVLGTVLVIASSTSRIQSLAGKLLSFRFMTWIGGISYSLYLWHWPILSLTRYVLDAELGWYGKLLGMGLSVVVAWGSLRLVENPIRSRMVFSHRKSLFAMSGLTVLILLAFCSWVWWTKGAAYRTAQESGLARESESVDAKLVQGQLPLIGDQSASPSFLLWGDSHAGIASPVFEEIAKEVGVSGYVASKGGNPPVPHVRISWNDELDEWNEGVVRFLENHPVEKVFLVARWAIYANGATVYDVSQGAFLNGPLLYDSVSPERTVDRSWDLLKVNLSTMIDELKGRGIQVYIVAQVPEVAFDPFRREFIARRSMNFWMRRQEAVDGSIFLERQDKVLQYFRELSEEGVHVLHPEKKLLLNRNNVLIYHGEQLIYRDSHHLSPYGAQFVYRDIVRGCLGMDLNPAPGP